MRRCQYRLMLVAICSCFGLRLAGCYSCTLKNCTDRFEVRIIQSESDPTADGSYEIEFTWPGGSKQSVAFSVGSGGGETGAAPLPDQGWPDWWGLERIENNQLYVNIAPFLVAELDTEGLYESHVESPEDISLWVRSNDTLIGQETVHPDYNWYWCNAEYGKCDHKKNYRTEVTIIVDYPPETADDDT